MPITADNLRAEPDADVTIGYSVGPEPFPITLRPVEGENSRCRLRIYRPTKGITAAIISESADNAGTSVTNAAERLACMILNHYILSGDWPNVVFFQHYPPEWFAKWNRAAWCSNADWTEELQYFQPAIRWCQAEDRWIPDMRHQDTTWRHLAHLVDCNLHITPKPELPPYNACAGAIVTWLFGRDADLLNPDISGFTTLYGMNPQIARTPTR